MNKGSTKINQIICEDCRTDKCYQRPNRKTPDWKKTDTGFRCKSCEGKHYRSKTFIPKSRTPRKGPCVVCKKETTYVEKSGYARWYNGPNGTLCKKCYNRINDQIPKYGKCVICKVKKTKHGWSETPKGKICQQCYKKSYHQIVRGGDCRICKTQEHKRWREHKEHGRICADCFGNLERKEIKKETLSHYSNGKIECANCGYNKNINGLELDHIPGKSSKPIDAVEKKGGWPLYSRLKKQGFPKGFQVLCATCNKIKQIETDPKGI